MFWQSLQGHVITDARWDGDTLTHVEIGGHTWLELPPSPEILPEDLQGIVWAATTADPDLALRINRWARETEFSTMTQQVCLSCNHVQSRRADSCEACWADNLTERPRPKQQGFAKVVKQKATPPPR